MIRANQRLLPQNAQIHQPQFVGIRVPGVIRFTAWMLIGVFIVTASVVLVARSTGKRFDLFAGYADVLPGQSRDNLEAAGFECGSHYSDDLFVEACSLRPATGIFSRITLSTSYDIIDRAIFTPRENALPLGEVALAFGAQRGSHRPRSHSIMDEGRAVVWMETSWVSYFQHVRILYLYYRGPEDLDQEY